MDSFFSLFDPSDGHQNKNKKKHQNKELDNVKKKADAPKGRRRGRKAQGKHETLPEESSFLCEPQLSPELLARDGSYIECYIALNKDPAREEETKTDDKKPKRRNSGRKNRRWKKSPPKEEGVEVADAHTTQWNNRSAIPKICTDVGKNVNDLNDYKKNKRKEFEEGAVHNVIDKLEKVILKDDTYLAGDFNADDLDNEPWCSSDEPDESFDDTSSDGDGSGDEAYGSLPPEPRFGNVEYKLQLVAPCERRFQHLVTQLADTQQSVELRVAVMGANEAGKSTLVGVLTQGELDNGRGSARLNMFRHLHEVKSGRTSSLSHEILGFDAQGNVVNYGCSELMTAERIGERSAKLVSFLDLAGHSKYQRTTLHGLSGYSPHYAMLVISATAGITRITEEHIGLLLALDLPFFAVVSKCELAPANLPLLVAGLAAILEQANKKPLLITDENLARNCVGPQNLILDSIDGIHNDNQKDEERQLQQVAVFPVSCVRGAGLNALHAYLLALQPPATPPHQPDHDSCEFQIDEIFHVGESSGPVVGGLLARGELYEGDNLIIGPLDTGEFVETSVRTIYRNRVPCGAVRAGQSASLGLARAPRSLRPGMVLLAEPERRAPARRPAFGACPPGHCARHQTTFQNLPKHKKHKQKNLYHTIVNVESSLAKPIDNKAENIYTSDSDEGKVWDCECRDQVLLEDPNDPRGCMYFQASIHLLRHSTAITPGFQCTVHCGNVRQTAIIEGIMSHNSALRCGESAPALFRFARCPEHLVRGRRLLLAAGGGTRAIGRVTQIFPYVP